MPAPANHNGRTRDLSPVTIRFSVEERAEREAAATAEGLTLSEWIRRRTKPRARRVAAK